MPSVSTEKVLKTTVRGCEGSDIAPSIPLADDATFKTLHLLCRNESPWQQDCTRQQPAFHSINQPFPTAFHQHNKRSQDRLGVSAGTPVNHFDMVTPLDSTLELTKRLGMA